MTKRIAILAISLAIIGIGVLTLKHPSIVHAQSTAQVTQFGTFTQFGTGWASNVLIVQTTAPYVDNGCNGTATAQYATLDGAPGNPTIHAVLLGAMLSGKPVELVVQGCAYGHPQIIGVAVQP